MAWRGPDRPRRRPVTRLASRMSDRRHGFDDAPSRTLTTDFAAHMTSYAYGVLPPNRGGARPDTGLCMGAGHAAELSYLFPSFNNGTVMSQRAGGRSMLIPARMRADEHRCDFWAGITS